MKKLLFLAAVVMAAGACSRTYDVNPAADKAIDFGTWAENLTKARTAGTNKFAKEDDFAVFGYKLKGTTKTTVFAQNDHNVVSTTDGSTWTYTPKRFWDQNAVSYTFYAVSPAAIGNTADTVKVETGAITSTAITFHGYDNDVLVSKETIVDSAAYTRAAIPSRVAMHFNHIASLVDFKVKKHDDLDDATVSITGFSLSNIKNKGTFRVASYDSLKCPKTTWTAAGDVASFTYENDTDTLTTSYPSNIAATKAAASKLISGLVAMPQTFDTTAVSMQKATISYTITYADNSTNTFENVDIPIHKFDKVDDKQNVDTFVGGWAPGKHYTFYITINDRAIEFTADINDWTKDEGYYYLVK